MPDESERLGMAGEPPSARYPAIPADPAEHAVRVAREWQDVAEIYVRRRMRELGVPEARIGSSDHLRRIGRRAFFADEDTGGGLATGGRINVDSGVLNPEHAANLAPPAPEAWRRARLRDRIDAVIAHEDMEFQAGTHEAAVVFAPETSLPIGGRPRALLRAIRLGEQSIRRGGASPSR
jgi:hypothetical protein